MKRCLSAVFAVAVCVSALFADKVPDWTSGQSRKYPGEKYLIGVGLGKDVDGARSSARAEISKIFKTRVTQSASDASSERLLRDGGETKSSSLAESAQNVTVSTDQELTGSEIAETWFDKKSKTWYALAVLDRHKLRTALAFELSDLEEKIQSLVSQANRSASTIDKIRALVSALSLWDKKEEIAERKRVVDPAAVPDTGDASSRAAIEAERNAAMKTLLFEVDAQGDSAALREIVSDRIAKLGFGIATGGAKAAEKTGATLITVNCRAEIEPFDRGNRQWKFYNWSSGAEISEAKSGGVSFASVSKRGQSSALSDESARKKASLDAAQALGLAVEERISRDIFGKY